MSISGAIFFSAFLAVFFGWISSHAASAWKLWLGFFVFTDGLTRMRFAPQSECE